jgi:hypothetical protein
LFSTRKLKRNFEPAMIRGRVVNFGIHINCTELVEQKAP